MVEPMRALLETFERIVDRIQNAIAAYFEHGREQGGRSKISAGRDVDVLAEILPHGALAGVTARRLLHDVVDPPYIEWNAFTEVAKDHLKFGIAVEQSR